MLVILSRRMARRGTLLAVVILAGLAATAQVSRAQSVVPPQATPSTPSPAEVAPSAERSRSTGRGARQAASAEIRPPRRGPAYRHDDQSRPGRGKKPASTPGAGPSSITEARPASSRTRHR
jgi:hypothetical protein